jgi:hypothetical protein
MMAKYRIKVYNDEHHGITFMPQYAYFKFFWCNMVEPWQVPTEIAARKQIKIYTDEDTRLANLKKAFKPYIIEIESIAEQ